MEKTSSFISPVSEAGQVTNPKNHPLYQTWIGIKTRCNNKNSDAYHLYGGRGITICSRWNSFGNFVSDMGNKPAGTLIERVDNNKGYTPDNCVWSTPAKQARNRRSNVNFTHNGKTMCMTDWCRELNLSFAMVSTRIYRNWSFEKAISTPNKYGNSRKG